VRRTDTLGEANPLTGLMFCADCGAKMYNHRKSTPTVRVRPSGKIYTASPEDKYVCSTNSLGKQSHKDRCSQHYIRTPVVRELVLDIIKRVSGFVKSNEAEFIRQVREESAVQQDAAAKSHKRQLAKAKKRHAELDRIISNLYEDKVGGSLSDKRFETLSAGYEHEQAELESQIATLSAEIETFDADSVRVDKFIGLVKRYTDFSELTTPMIMEFVDKIIVHEADRSTGERIQKVDVYLNFIGKFDVPEEEPTAEEIAELERIRQKREKKREYHRRYMAKKLRKAQEQAETEKTVKELPHVQDGNCA
jgi:hypothetical protein